jgi:hypothetical protein
MLFFAGKVCSFASMYSSGKGIIQLTPHLVYDEIPRCLMYHSADFSNDVLDDLDVHNGVSNAFDLDEALGSEEDENRLVPRLPPLRDVQPQDVRRRIREKLAGKPLSVGEIVPHHDAQRGLGQLILRKEPWLRGRRLMPGIRGRRALVTYDPRGNVYMRVYTDGMKPIGGTFHVGRVSLTGLPAAHTDRGTAIEPRIRRLIEQASGIAFKWKHPNAPGPDLEPVRQRTPPRGSAGVRTVARFDDLADFDDQMARARRSPIDSAIAHLFAAIANRPRMALELTVAERFIRRLPYGRVRSDLTNFVIDIRSAANNPTELDSIRDRLERYMTRMWPVAR